MKRLLILLSALIGLQTVALAFYSISELDAVAQEAELIVHGRVVKLWKTSPEPDWMWESIAKLEVLKTIHGKSGKHIYVIMRELNTMGGDDTSLLLNEEYMLFLKHVDVNNDEYPKKQYNGVRADKTYKEINLGYTAIHIKNGLAHFRKEMRIDKKKNLSRLLGKRTVKEVEEAILWFRGLKMSVRSSHKSVSCGGRLEFAVTLTNDSPLHMELKFADAKARYGDFRLGLIDEHGFPVLRDKIYSGVPGGEYLEKRLSPEVIKLKPGESVEREVSFYVPLFNYQQNPGSVRKAQLWFCAQSHLPWDDKIEYGDICGCWTGELTAECAVDVSCNMNKWESTLARPGKEWQFRLSSGPFDESFRQATPQQRKEVFLQGVKHGYANGRDVLLLENDQKKELSSYFQITRNGAVIQKASDTPYDMMNILSSDRLRSSVAWTEKFDLAEYVDLSAPGDYKIRFQLKESDKLAWSNEVAIRVLERKTVDLVTAGDPSEGRVTHGGLVLTARADKGVFLCDGPMDFRVGFENIGDKDIRLKCVPEGASDGGHFDLSLLDKNGFSVLLGWDVYIGGKQDDLYVVKPRRKIDRTIRFYVPIGKYFANPDEVRYARVEYHPRGRGNGLWNRSLAVKCPVKIVNPYAEWGKELARSEGHWRCKLSVVDCENYYVTVSAPDEDLWLELVVWGQGDKLPRKESLIPEVKRQLGSYLEVTKDGKIVKSPSTNPAVLHGAFAKYANRQCREMTSVINLSEHVSLKDPGVYCVRFRITEDGAVSESNILTITVPITLGIKTENKK